MQFMILRKAGSAPEQPSSDAALCGQPGRVVPHAAEALRPTPEGARLRFSHGRVSVHLAPPEGRGDIAAFAMVDAATRADAMAWAVAQVAGEAGPVALEVRDGGCPGGLRGVPAADDDGASGTRYMVLLKAHALGETGAVPAADDLARMARRNDEAVAAGVLLMGEGLQTSASASRVTVPAPGRGKPLVVDGPFAEAKELLAGFWIIRAASLQAAIDWATDYPFAFRDTQDIEVDVRPLAETRGAASLTPLQAAGHGPDHDGDHLKP